jgi:hypothetical protein
MFDGLVAAAQDFWDDVKIDDFCVPCFLKGAARGAAIGLTALLVLASLPAAVATAATVALAVVGVAGLAMLAARWNTMSGAQKSEVLGDLAGGVIAGGIGMAKPPPGMQLMSAAAADGSSVFVPVLVTSEVSAAPAAGGAAVMMSKGGSGSPEPEEGGLSDREKKRAEKQATKTRDEAREGKRKTSKDYHGRLDADTELEVLSEPDGVYQSTGGEGRQIFHKDGNVVVVETGSGRGNIITSYGDKGPRGESGAAIYGGDPAAPGPAITGEQVQQGLPRPGGGTTPPAVPLDI